MQESLAAMVANFLFRAWAASPLGLPEELELVVESLGQKMVSRKTGADRMGAARQRRNARVTMRADNDTDMMKMMI